MIRPDLEAVNPHYKEYIQKRANEVGAVLSSIPIFNIDELIANFNEDKVTNIGGGHKCQIFKLDAIIPGQITTLKIPTLDSLDYFLSFEEPDTVEDWDPLYEYQGVKSIKLARDISVLSGTRYWSELALRQIWGHAIGSLRMPHLVDPPVGIWAVNPEGKNNPIVIGYSLPFVEGRPIRINDDPELIAAADTLAAHDGLYAGNRSESFNAIVDADADVKKLIDVEVRF